MSQPFTFRCLGRPVLLAPDGTEVRLKVRKHLGLLAYLALEPREPWRRDLLTDLLWPRAPLGDARHSLATGVSMLRTILGPRAIETGRDRVRFATGELVTDLARLEAGNILGDEFTPRLELGDLLQDLDLPDAPSFDHWKDRLRARWRPTIQTALVALLDRARRVGDWRELDRLADRLFQLEDLSEQGIRAKMEAAALAGDRVGALKLFEQWQVRLREELSAAPSPVMQRFATHLRGGGSSGDPARRVPSRVATPEPFVGREAEYQVLYEVWEEVLERRPGHALVRGEAGTGKTSLVARLFSATALNGAAVARVRCYELEREIPYAAIIALCRGLLLSPGAAATPPEALADLGQILPAVRARFDGLPAPVVAQGESARLRFTEAAFQLITAVAEEQPVVLAVDDYHLADNVSLAVLHLIMRRLEDQRVMMVFAGRADEASRSPNATRLLDAAADIGVRVVTLMPLADEECEEVLVALLGDGKPDVALRRAILRAARGCPLALVLLARDWEARGEAGGALQLAGMTRDLEATEPQDEFGPLLDRVLLRLEPAARPVLDLAAVLGGRMNDLRFYALVGAPAAQSLGALSILTDRRVLRDGGAGLEFVNEILRAHVYLRLPVAIRRHMHAVVADELLVRDQDQGEVTGLELAWHLMRCGRTTEASRYLLMGARDAIDHGAAWEAERAIVTGVTELHGEQVVEGRLLLAEALFEQGRDRETREVVLRTDSSSFPRWMEMGRALALSALRHAPDQPVAHAEESFHDLLGLVKNAKQSRTRALAARGAAVFTNKLGNRRVAEMLLDAPAEVEHDGFTAIDLADLEYAKATALYELRKLDASEQWALQATSRLEDAGLTNSTLLGLYCGRGAIKCARGHYADAIPLLEKAHSIAKHIGNQATIRPCLSNLALCHLRLGNYQAQIRFGELACHRTPDMQSVFGDVTYSYHLAMGYALSGDAQRAFDALALGDAAADCLASAWSRQQWLLGRADVLHILGRRVEAMKTAAQGVGATFDGVLNWSHTGAYARWTALVVRTSDDAKRALKEIQGLLTQLEHFDALDRAEILAAAVFLNQLVDLNTDAEEAQLRDVLRILPDPVAKTMKRFGFLESVRPLDAARKSRQRRKSGAKQAGDLGGCPSQDPDSLD